MMYGNFLAGVEGSILALFRIEHASAATLLLILCGLFSRKLPQLFSLRRQAVLTTVAVLGAISSALTFIAAGRFNVLVIICVGIMGLASGSLILLWAISLKSLSHLQSHSQIVSVAVVSSYVIFVLILNLPAGLSASVAIALPCLAIAGIRMMNSQSHALTYQTLSPVRLKDKPSLSLNTLLQLLVFGLILGIVNTKLTFDLNAQMLTGGAVVIAITILGILYALASILANRTELDLLKRVITPLMAIGLLLLTQFTLSVSVVFAAAFVIAGYCAAEIFCWISCTQQVSEEQGVAEVLKAFGIGQFSKSLGLALGISTGAFLSGALANWIPFLLFAIFILLVIFAAFSGGSTERSKQPEGASPSYSATELLKMAARENSSIISNKHGLTSRESEVLELLIQGRTAEAIAKELCITLNTAKSHKRHIYSKLMIHSHEDLLALVEDTTA
jgi:DNA-binding CsgD family transcriptional regulator